MTLSDNRRCRVEQALLGQEVERTACFPLVDVVYAAAFGGVPPSVVQLDPASHAAALCECLDGLPIDGVYVNLCFSQAQAAGAEFRDGRGRLLLDDCLELAFEQNDVAAVVHTQVASLDDARIGRAELFHQGMLENVGRLAAACKQTMRLAVGARGVHPEYGLPRATRLDARGVRPDGPILRMTCRFSELPQRQFIHRIPRRREK